MKPPFPSPSPPPITIREFGSTSAFPTCTKMSGHREAPTTTRQETSQASRDLDCSSHCPFCNILLAFPPVDPLGDPQEIAQILDHEKTNPPCVVVYSGERVMAFLDIQPLTWGHTLVIPRRHRVRMGDLEAADGAEVSCTCCLSVLPRRCCLFRTNKADHVSFCMPWDASSTFCSGSLAAGSVDALIFLRLSLSQFLSTGFVLHSVSCRVLSRGVLFCFVTSSPAAICKPLLTKLLSSLDVISLSLLVQ